MSKILAGQAAAKKKFIHFFPLYRDDEESAGGKKNVENMEREKKKYPVGTHIKGHPGCRQETTLFLRVA